MKPQHRGFSVFAIAGFLIGMTVGHSGTGAAAAFPAVKIVRVEVVRTLGVHDFAKELLTPTQYKCLDYILNRETNGWNPVAVNPSSGASGLGQLLPQTWRSLAYAPTKNGNAQVLATLVYIARHYAQGGVCAAAAFHKKHGWY
jgi:hypothetical protein